MYNVKVNLPNIKRGGEVEIDGLGVLKNGRTTVVSEEAGEAFRAKHSTTVATMEEDGSMTSQYVHGPTLLQAFEHNEYITVTRSEGTTPPKDDDDEKKDEDVTENV